MSGTDPAADPPVNVNVWGPPVLKARRPVGMGDVIVGLVLFFLLSSIPAVIAFMVLLPKFAAMSDPSAVVQSVTEAGPVIISSLVLSWCGLLIPVWWAATRKGDGDWRALLKWQVNWRRDIPLALAFMVVLRSAEAIVGWLLELLGVDTSALGNGAMLSTVSGGWLIAMLLGASIGAPIVEEIFFRGLFLSVAIRNWGRWFGVIVTSATFGLMHAQATVESSLYTVSSTAIIGLCLALLVLRTNRLGTSILSHIAFNTSGVVLMLISGGLT